MMQKAVSMYELALKLVEDGATTIYRIDNPERFRIQCTKKRLEWGLHPSAKNLKKICCGYKQMSPEILDEVKIGTIDKWRYPSGLECELYAVKSCNGEEREIRSIVGGVKKGEPPSHETTRLVDREEPFGTGSFHDHMMNLARGSRRRI